MGPSQFFGYNVLAIGGILLAVMLYLIFLINKRRRQKFLHSQKPGAGDNDTAST